MAVDRSGHLRRSHSGRQKTEIAANGVAMKDVVLPAFTSLFFALAALTAVAQSPDPLLGTFKVNVEKSTPNAGAQPAKSNISVWQALGDGQFKNTIDVVDAKVRRHARRSLPGLMARSQP